MGVPLEHQIFAGEEIAIYGCQVITETGIPGSIYIRWDGDLGENELVLTGERAAAFLEDWRSAPGEPERRWVIEHKIREVMAQ